MEDVGPLVVDRGNEKTFLLCLGVFPLSYSAGKKRVLFHYLLHLFHVLYQPL